jgi:hypothetical protein
MKQLKFYSIIYFYTSGLEQGWGSNQCFLDKNKINHSNSKYLDSISKVICKKYNFENIIITNIY